jgi:hypothetical protein
LSRVIHVVVATTTTYKLSLSNGDTSGAFSIYNSAINASSLAWTKLA